MFSFVDRWRTDRKMENRMGTETKRRIESLIDISPRYTLRGISFNSYPSSDQINVKLDQLKKEDPAFVLQLLIIQARTYHPLGLLLIFYQRNYDTRQYIALLEYFAIHHPMDVLNLLMTKSWGGFGDGVAHMNPQTTQKYISLLMQLALGYQDQVLAILAQTNEHMAESFGHLVASFQDAETTRAYIKLLMQLALDYPEQVLSLLKLESSRHARTFGHQLLISRLSANKEYFSLLEQLAVYYPEEVLGFLMIQPSSDRIYLYQHSFSLLFSADDRNDETILSCLVILENILDLGGDPSIIQARLRDIRERLISRLGYTETVLRLERHRLVLEGLEGSVKKTIKQYSPLDQTTVYPLLRRLEKIDRELERDRERLISEYCIAEFVPKVKSFEEEEEQEEVKASVDEPEESEQARRQKTISARLKFFDLKERAATKIQAFSRDWLIRQEILRFERATKIQALLRSWLIRKKMWNADVRWLRHFCKIEGYTPFSPVLINNVLLGLQGARSEIDQMDGDEMKGEALIQRDSEQNAINRLACLKVLALVLSISEKLTQEAVPLDFITQLVFLFPRATVGYESRYKKEEDGLLAEISQKLFLFHIVNQPEQDTQHREQLQLTESAPTTPFIGPPTPYKVLINIMLFKDRISSWSDDKLISLSKHCVHGVVTLGIPNRDGLMVALNNQIAQYSANEDTQALCEILKQEIEAGVKEEKVEEDEEELFAQTWGLLLNDPRFEPASADLEEGYEEEVKMNPPAAPTGGSLADEPREGEEYLDEDDDGEEYKGGGRDSIATFFHRSSDLQIMSGDDMAVEMMPLGEKKDGV